MSTGPAGGGYQTSEDEQILHRMGYAQELFRAMGGFQNFAISFTIISILAGCFTSYFIAFNNGGPIAISWGWPIVAGFILLIGFTMSELVSAYPTSGGIYWWASKMGGPAAGFFGARWSRHSDLNRGPAVYETAALPLSYVGPGFTLSYS